MNTKVQSPPQSSAEPIGQIQFPAWPYFAEDEIAAATKVLQSGKVNYWTGNEVKGFEKKNLRHI